MNSTNNLAQYERMCRVMPAGLSSNFRKDSYIPTYFNSGSGSKLYDFDGNEHIDYTLGFGPSLLGHGNRLLNEALHRQIDRMCTTGNNFLKVEAAELVCQHIPCAEQVFFTCSGTEAIANAARVARAYTGRNMIVRFNGHYHGSHDAYLGGIVVDPRYPVVQAGHQGNDKFSQQTDTAGRARHAMMDCFMVEWNDRAAVEALLEQYHTVIAAVLMEPVMINSNGCLPESGYLEGIRALCDRYGVLLIFDEIITGYRLGLGGAQKYFDVIPDLCALGKAIGGGVMPVSGFCGRRDVMAKIASREVICAGTYNGHPLAMAAVVATTEALAADGGAASHHIELLGNRLAEGLRALFDEYQVPMIVQGIPGALCLGWSKEGLIRNHADAVRQDGGASQVDHFSKLLRDRGILVWGRFYTSAVHTDNDVDTALAVAREACEELVGGS